MNVLKFAFACLLALLSAVSVPAFATDLDVSGLVTTISGTLTPIGLVGMAVLAVMVGVKVFKWIRRAL